MTGRQIAITGRLASMSRPRAVALIERAGGRYVALVNRQTSILVLGQEGWPLRRDGGLTKSLREARQLQKQGEPIQILAEGQFLGLIGLGDRPDGIRRLFTSEQVCRTLKISSAELRHWLRIGLVHPVQQVRHLCYFDFEQVSSAKAISDLRRRGVTVTRIRSSLQQLKAWQPGAEKSLAQLAMLAEKGDLLLRVGDGQLADFNGQLRLDFGAPAEAGPAECQVLPGTFEDWFGVAIRHEENEEWEAACRAYHRALLQDGPIAEVAFNLGNCLYALGRKGAASQRFMQAVESDPEFVEAWNNLGNVLSELELLPDALEAFENALRIDPDYADAHFNLAECLHQSGQIEGARHHWREYLKRDPHSSWAGRVQRLLDQTEE